MENELLSLIPEYIPLGLGVYDKDGYLKYANDTTLKMFGVIRYGESASYHISLLWFRYTLTDIYHTLP